MVAGEERKIAGPSALAFLVVAVIVLSAIPIAGSDNGSPEGDTGTTDQAERKWTIAMYWASDNNLDEYTEYFVTMWMEHLTNREDIALCVFLDRLELPANISTLTEDGWTEVANLGEVNSSSPDTLSSFIEYALTEPTLASENFMLIVQNHGNGYLGLCSDEGLPDSELESMWMSIDGLGSGIRSALDATGKTIDVISLDACTMGTVEIAYELRNTASYLVSSQLGVPFDGQNYIALLSGLSQNPDIGPEELACKLVDDYADWYSAPLGTYPTLYPYMQDFASLSVVDLNALEPLIRAFDAFREEVIPKDNTLGKMFRDAATQADVAIWLNNMGVWFYPDIRVMFELLGDSTRDSHPSVAACCDDIVDAAAVAIVHEWASWRTRGIATGLSVFVSPSIGVFEAHWDSLARVYDGIGLDFLEDTGWEIVLKAYFYTVKQYGNPPVFRGSK